MNVPAFIARRFYVPGSLRNEPHGFSLQAHNPIGDGIVVGVGRVAVDRQVVDPAAISAMRDGDAHPIRAADVTRYQPIRIARGDRVTLLVEGPRLAPGEHVLEVELFERDLGALRFSITEPVVDVGEESGADAEAANADAGRDPGAG
jgi:hypothetical protein